MSVDTASDPSEKLSPELVWHLHLVSSFKTEDRGDAFSFSSEQIKDLLQAAAEEKRDTERPSAWSWQKIDLPRDRTSLIVWQSDKSVERTRSNHIATPPDHFPTDGYAWGSPNEISKEQLGSHTLECHTRKSGFAFGTVREDHARQESFVTGVEKYTIHSRTRYRLVPSGANEGESPCDPNIWLVLYHRSAGNHVLPVMNPAVQENVKSQVPSLLARQHIFDITPTPEDNYSIFGRGLDIKQKGFVWKTTSWPAIHLPEEQLDRSVHAGSNHIARGVRGQYTAGQGLLRQPSAKRQKMTPQGSEIRIPEGEDEGGRDIMDVLTPREISLERYKQHSEWMEELFVSPYPIHKMVPVSLGLGRAGALSKFGPDEFIDAPMDHRAEQGIKKPSVEQYKAWMQSGEDFITEMKAEMEKEQAIHERRMAKIRQSGAIQDAERKLRSAVQFPQAGASKSTEQTEAIPTPADQDIDVAMLRQIDDVKRIAQDVENLVGRKIEVTEQAHCVSRGGLEEKAPTPPEQQDVKMDDAGEGVPNDNLSGALNDFSKLDGNGARSQSQSNDPLAPPDDDFEMIDKNDMLDVGEVGMASDGADLSTGQGGLPELGSGAEGAMDTPGDDFDAQFLNLPDDDMDGPSGDDFGTSAFDAAFDDTGADQGHSGGDGVEHMMGEQQ